MYLLSYSIHFVIFIDIYRVWLFSVVFEDLSYPFSWNYLLILIEWFFFTIKNSIYRNKIEIPWKVAHSFFKIYFDMNKLFITFSSGRRGLLTFSGLFHYLKSIPSLVLHLMGLLLSKKSSNKNHCIDLNRNYDPFNHYFMLRIIIRIIYFVVKDLANGWGLSVL